MKPMLIFNRNFMISAGFRSIGLMNSTYVAAGMFFFSCLLLGCYSPKATAGRSSVAGASAVSAAEKAAAEKATAGQDQSPEGKDTQPPSSQESAALSTKDISASKHLSAVRSLVLLPPELAFNSGDSLDVVDNARDYLLQAMQAELGIEVADAGESLAVYRNQSELDREIGAGRITQIPLIATAREAQKLGYDAIVRFRITELVERSGSRIGTEDPARVIFSLSLWGVNGESRPKAAAPELLWEKSYLERDQSVSENLLQLGDRLRSDAPFVWKTSSQLLHKGINRAVSDLARARSSHFIKN